ncbi:MAG: hypothetical protein JNM55_13130 [Anaerolineales bacterium]|nr:hypothetical protein [Anaerolineales bacterium]
MSSYTTPTGTELTNALYALGVKFILGGTKDKASLHKDPIHMIIALAESNESRLRLSLIPLFLEHPEFSSHAKDAADEVSSEARLTLQCYYSAAVWLQQKHQAKLESLIGRKVQLPDYFSSELGLQRTDDPETNLYLLAKRHQELSGSQVNWLGTYKHAAHVLIKGLEL